FIDDGSSDGSFQQLKTIADKNPEHIILISLRRNFGQTAAIAAGIDHATGDILVLMDADMQNDPTDIPLLLKKIDEGYDVVSGWRVNRKDNKITRVLPSRIANKLISWVTGVHLHDYGCSLKAYRKDILADFRLYGEMHRFIPAFAAHVGAKITEVDVKHHPRKFGKTSYGMERTLKVVLDLFTVKFLISYSQNPLYLFGGLGLFLLLGGIAILLFLLIRRLGLGISPFSSPLFPTSIMIVVMGFQSILMGLIAELLVRTYYEAQDKPIYTIRKIINEEK
ncbi:MAG: glycosyltransferase family 2 protein, partial [Anaerolineales bacterium]|nr:glycosyltransferase family 2 protein [Anaerolineales bacterium]